MEKATRRIGHRNQILVIGMGMAVLIWLGDALLDTFLLEKDHLLRPAALVDGNGILVRILFVLVVTGLTLYARLLLVREQTISRTLESGETQLRTILATVREGIYALDSAGNTTYLNAAAARLTGWDPDELIGKSHHEALYQFGSDGSPYAREECPIDATIRDGQVQRVNNEVFWRKNGSSFAVEYVSAPIYDGDQLAGAVVTFRDISRRRKAEGLASQVAEELREAKRAAEAASRAKTEFLTNMSHEIRTPMTAILGYCDELLEGGDLTQIPPERLSAVNAIKRNGNHLLQLLNDILDVSKIEAGKLTIERLPFSPIHLVADVSSMMRVRASEKGLELSIDYPTPLPESIECDPTRVRQILINLVGNAIKFTDSGTIRLVTQLVHHEADAMIQFEVMDPGIGMTSEEITRLFNPFTQADASTTRKYGGTGLGLSICHHLVQVMGGTIGVESEPGHGSTFRVTFPLGTLEGVPLIENPSQAVKTREDLQNDPVHQLATEPLDCRILLAEDGPDNQRLIRRLLERAGAEVEVVENGRIALERALEVRENGNAFDVILMDMQMPVLDGYDATRALRQASYDLPIIALTAHVLSSDREKCLAVGCDEFVAKPVDKTSLIETISRYVGNGKQSGGVLTA